MRVCTIIARASAQSETTEQLSGRKVLLYRRPGGPLVSLGSIHIRNLLAEQYIVTPSFYDLLSIA